MKLKELFSPWIPIEEDGEEIEGLYNDSRKVKPGGIFFAYPGSLVDGRCHMNQALEAGALALIYEPQGCIPPVKGLSLPLKNVAEHLGLIAARFYQQPSQKMRVLGVTGTNGKTSIAYQLAQAHEFLGQKARYIGTLGQGRVNGLSPLANTTPDALCLQGLLHGYLAEEVKVVTMEVSSHSLVQKRVSGIDFRQAIFSNLTLDHLDYHQTMDAYARAKALLFASPGLETAIINVDNEYAQLMIEANRASCRLLTYGLKKPAELRALSWNLSLRGTELELESPWGKGSFMLQGLGFFNIYNALAIVGSLLASGYSLSQIQAVMAELKPAPGRMEIVAKEPYILVDYAHTPDALEQVLKTLVKIKQAKLLVVFGCGGNRDISKRPLMGKIATTYADIAIVTSDNPRGEDPEKILNDIKPGISARARTYFLADRKEAIAKAISLAGRDDLILIAGKGHEAYQEIKGKRHVFSDQAVVKELLAN